MKISWIKPIYCTGIVLLFIDCHRNIYRDPEMHDCKPLTLTSHTNIQRGLHHFKLGLNAA